MDSKDAQKHSPGASKTPVGSPKSPVGSPGKGRASKSPDQRSPTPTADGLLPGNYWTEGPTDDDDPALDDIASSTASLSSSVLEYRTLQGRTFHGSRGNAEYWAPNDDKQTDALDLIHHAHTMILDGKLFLAPLKDNIQKVVDIATGTGNWAIDFADEYPNCEVVGTDLSPIQPTWIPPNLKFEIDDCTQPWTFAPDSIDYVHLRYMTGCIKDWPALFKEAYRCIKPGGYIESFDAGAVFECDDGTMTETSAMAQWGKIFAEGGKMLGRTFRILLDDIQTRGLKDAGCVDIETREFKVPLGTWPKDPDLKQIGACTSKALYDDVEGYMLYMTTGLGWTKEEVMVYAAHLRREIRDPTIHGYYRVRVAWGKKPEA